MYYNRKGEIKQRIYEDHNDEKIIHPRKQKFTSDITPKDNIIIPSSMKNNHKNKNHNKNNNNLLQNVDDIDLAIAKNTHMKNTTTTTTTTTAAAATTTTTTNKSSLSSLQQPQSTITSQIISSHSNERLIEQLTTARQEISHLRQMITNAAMETAEQRIQYKKEIAKLDAECDSYKNQLLVINNQNKAIHQEMEANKTAISEAMSEKGEILWRLRESEAEIAANRQLLYASRKNEINNHDGNGNGNGNGTTGETREMIVERTKAEMRQVWARMRQMWEEEMRGEIIRSEELTTKKVKSEMNVIIKDMNIERNKEIAILKKQYEDERAENHIKFVQQNKDEINKIREECEKQYKLEITYLQEHMENVKKVEISKLIEKLYLKSGDIKQFRDVHINIKEKKKDELTNLLRTIQTKQAKDHNHQDNLLEALMNNNDINDINNNNTTTNDGEYNDVTAMEEKYVCSVIDVEIAIFKQKRQDAIFNLYRIDRLLWAKRISRCFIQWKKTVWFYNLEYLTETAISQAQNYGGVALLMYNLSKIFETRVTLRSSWMKWHRLCNKVIIPKRKIMSTVLQNRPDFLILLVDRIVLGIRRQTICSLQRIFYKWRIVSVLMMKGGSVLIGGGGKGGHGDNDNNAVVKELQNEILNLHAKLKIIKEEAWMYKRKIITSIEDANVET